MADIRITRSKDRVRIETGTEEVTEGMGSRITRSKDRVRIETPSSRRSPNSSPSITRSKDRVRIETCRSAARWTWRSGHHPVERPGAD